MSGDVLCNVPSRKEVNPLLQTTSFDLGAIATQQQSATQQASRRPQSDFGSFYQRAQAQDTPRAPERDRAPVRNHDEDDASAKTDETPSSADATEQPSDDDHAVQSRSDADDGAARPEPTRRPEGIAKAVKPEQPAKADKPAATDKPQAAATQAADKPADGDAKANPADAQAPDAKPDPQATLALMLATGAQLAQPAAPAPAPAADAPTAQADATATAKVDGNGKAATTPADAMAQALAAAGKAQAQAQDPAIAQAQAQAAAQTQAQAQGKTSPQAQAQGQAQQPNGQPQAATGTAVPAALMQAAGNLGPIKIHVQGGKAMPTMAESLKEALNPATQAANGLTAQVTTSDGASSIEIPSQVLDLLATPDDAQQASPDGTDPNAALAAQATTTGVEAKPAAADAAAAAANAPQDAPGQPQEIMKQVLDRAEQVKASQDGAVKLQLFPEHLGKMEIRVVSHEGVISAQLTADNQHVKSILEGQVASLQKSFAELGLKVDKVEVTLSSSNLDFGGGGNGSAGASFSDGRQGQQGQNQAYQSRMGTGLGYEQWLPETPTTEAYASLDRDGAIDYVA